MAVADSDHTGRNKIAIRHFIRLKLRITANGLRGQTWRVALFVLGTVLAGCAAIGGYLMFGLPGLLGEQRAAEVALPLVGGLIVLGWLFLPLVFFGVDESLDPARFALLPVPRRTLIRGLFVASLAGVPAVATFAGTLGMVDTAAGPPSRAAESTMPSVPAKVAPAGTPAREATNHPRISVRRGSGSSAKRAGSSDSSTPKKTSGRNSQPSTMKEPASGSATSAARCSCSRPGRLNAA